MLIDYFDLNKRDPEARNHFYLDIPVHYCFKEKTQANGEKNDVG